MTMETKSKASKISELSFMSLFALIFGSMVGSGVFDIPQNIAYKSGVISVGIGWLITVVGILALSWAFIYITNKRPDIQSGLYGYAKHGFGDYIGFNSAWGYALNALIANTSYLIYICATLANFALFKFWGKGNNLYSVIIESILIWIVFLLINKGIKEAAYVNLVVTIIKIAILIWVIILLFIAFNSAQLIHNIHFDTNLGSIFEQTKNTMLVTVWNFTGIEAACIFALRSKSMRDVARATMLGAIVVCLIDASISILPFGIMQAQAIRNLATPSTASLLSSVYGMFSGNLVYISVIISVLGALLAWTMLASNMFYLSAEDKTMPKLFLKLNKNNVPYNAVLISSITAQVFVAVAYYTNAVYLMMIQFATSLILLPYLFAAMFALKLVLTDRKVDTISVFKGVLAVLYGVWLVYSGGLFFLALSSLMYLIGFIFYFIARKEHNLKLFDKKYELYLFIILIVVTVVALKF
jgi:arginine:ornithine antiporter/lysine permease